MDAPPTPTLPTTALPRPFIAPWWAQGPHLQTLAGKLLRRTDAVPLERERWDTPDGDFLDLDFAPDAGSDPGRGPAVLVLHGLEGSARRGYCVEAYAALAGEGATAVGLNFRSCSGEPNRRVRAYHSGETGDLALVLERLRERWPGRPLGALGFSLGGNVLLKLLGEREDGGRGLLDAAAVVSVPYNLAAGSDHLARGFFGGLYTRYFLRSLIGKARAKSHLLGGVVDLDALAGVRTLRTFDDLLTAPVHGFPDAETYYRESASAAFLRSVQVPTLLLHSSDDPFMPPDALPIDAIDGNPHLHSVLTDRGGHVGFVGGTPGRPRFWAEEAVARFLAVTLSAA